MAKSFSSEPSMDDILASIRRSVNGSDRSDRVSDEPEAEPEPEKATPEVIPVVNEEKAAEPGGVFQASGLAEKAVSDLLQRMELNRETSLFNRGPTIEDIVRAEIRPLLAAWLDEHLQPLVKSIVQQTLKDLLATPKA